MNILETVKYPNTTYLVGLPRRVNESKVYSGAWHIGSP